MAATTITLKLNMFLVEFNFVWAESRRDSIYVELIVTPAAVYTYT